MGSEGLQTVVAVALNFVPGCQVWCSALFMAQVNYYHTGSVGSALRAGTTSAAIAGVFYGIGQGAVALDAVGSPLHIGAHAVAGGIIADVQGGNFGHGFWSAGLTKWAQVGRYVPNDLIAGTIVSAVIGGTVSEISGGKFANGATTAAFQFVMNDWMTKAWTSDKFGDQILSHYVEGSGEALHLSSEEWAKYMKSNPHIRLKIRKMLLEHAKSNPESGEFSLKDAIKIGIDKGFMPYKRTGYGLLNGSNDDVGGFTIDGTLKVGKYGASFKFEYTATFNDIVDPRPEVGDGKWQTLADFVYDGAPKPYNIHISWQGKEILWPQN
ncbi:hypothetical protein N474_25600 [Pseudoalteromonas luteoviolacea CPMOR-2]|nr:hypothetical protein N474_25600 [Pseudoalteromonas luteoviolacea CPMOR-2]